MVLTFNVKYFSTTLIIFTLEVVIALFIKDNFIRPYLGDVLVVILMYCFLKSFLKSLTWPIVLFVFIFSITLEILQYINIIEKLGLENYKFTRIVLGSSFSFNDILAYLVGILIVILIDIVYKKEIKTIIKKIIKTKI